MSYKTGRNGKFNSLELDKLLSFLHLNFSVEKASRFVMFLKTDVFTIFVLVLVFGQCSGADLAASCQENTECNVPHAECSGTSGSKTCACVTGYTQASTACKANLGTVCNTTEDCDKTTTTAVCDVQDTPPVCKIKSTGDCSAKTDKCVSNATCKNNLCVCSTKYNESTADKLCATVLGQACSTSADCNTVAYSNCPGSGTKTCTCNTGYSKRGADCKADLGSVCTATSDCSLVTTTDAVCELNVTQKICSVGSGGDCSGAMSTKCITHSTCTSNVCTCDTGYAATAEKLCSPASGAEGLINMMSFALTLTSVFAVKIF